MRLDLELPNERRTILLDSAEIGRRLTDILRRENLPLNTRCGERLLCKSCSVEVQSNGGWTTVQACQVILDQNLTVRIPQQSMLAYTPQVLSGYRINVPYAHDPLLAPEGLCAVVDVGTTTVALSVVDLSDGRIVGQAAAFNRQMHYGDDVLTRINLCMTDPCALAGLQSAICKETISQLLAEAASGAGLQVSDVRGFVVAGNTTMLHLLAGIDPTPMGFSPFTPRFIGHTVLPSEALGLEPAGVPVHLLSGAAAYVGADITAGVFASGLVYDDGPSLIVDVGTNGEIVLKFGSRMYGCATAAGPAFEGSGLQSGLRAGDGAISHLWIRGETLNVETEIIGPPHTKPSGICGSAYIDFLAEAFRTGLVGSNGRLRPSALPVGDPRVCAGDHGGEFLIARGQGKRPIVVSDQDIARLLQAKAAIAAGILTLLARVGIQAADVKTLYLAGGFGMHLDLENAIACGLLPGFRSEQIQLIGNSSLGGATVCAIDRSALDEIARIGSDIEIVELNLDPDFEDTYIDQLCLGGG